MADFVCIIQKGQVAHRMQAELAEALRALGAEIFGDDPAQSEIRWTVMPSGFAFTAGEPSTSSIVVRSVPVGYPDDEREAYLHRVCDLWTELTGCSKDEIVATAFDGPIPVE